MKKFIILTIVVSILLLSVLSCEQGIESNALTGPERSPKGISSSGLQSRPYVLPETTGYESFTANLIAAQNVCIGYVEVWNDDIYLYVKYTITEPDWFLKEIHLHVAESLEGIPQTVSGNPIPGHFDYQKRYNCVNEVNETSFTIPVDEWECNQTLYIATHAVVQNSEMFRETEGAWGDGYDFPGANWATYFTYNIICDNGEGDLVGQFRTYTQEGWGSECDDSKDDDLCPGCYRDDNFLGCFPMGLSVGCFDGYMADFYPSVAIEVFLPASGEPAIFTQNHMNPTATEAGILAGQVVALTLNVKFDIYDSDFCASETKLRQLIVADENSPCYGWRVEDVLLNANFILGDHYSGNLTPYEINECVTKINENFVGATHDNGFLRLPQKFEKIGGAQ
jgi:hypothetical protein